MTRQPQEFSKRISDLTVHLGAEMMRSLQRYHEMLQRMASGDLDDATVRTQYLRFTRDETRRYFLGVAEATTGYYDAVLELASTYNPPFFEGAGAQQQPTSSTGAATHVGVIELRGTLGDEAAGAFRVDGTESESEEISFTVSEFSGPSAVAPFRPPLRLRPPRFTLSPLESRLVDVRLPLDSALFAPNQRYTATLTVQKRIPIVLTIEVLAGPPSDATRTFEPVVQDTGRG
jgi:hypothetical protein